MKLFAALFALVLFGFVGVARAQTASDMAENCAALSTPANSTDTKLIVEKAICIGYMKGFGDGVEDLFYRDETGKFYHISIQDGQNPVNFAQIFLAYLKLHPELQTKPLDGVLFDALILGHALVLTPANASSTQPVAPPKITALAKIILPYTADDDGVMTVKITINGFQVDALFDSGADAVIANFEEFHITPTGSEDFESAAGRMDHEAVGSAIVCAEKVCLKVEAADNPIDAPILLGRSFMKLFSSVTINRKTQTITMVP